MRDDREIEKIGWIEGMTTLAVVAILAVAFSPLVVRYVEDTRRETTTADMADLARAYVRYHADTGRWPCAWDGTRTTQTALTGQQCFHRPEPGLAGWDGPYLERGIERSGNLHIAVAPRGESPGEGLVDGWGQPFTVIYQAPTPHLAGADGGVIAIVSGGPDGQVDTSRRRVIGGAPDADDLVHVITRRVG
jgi:type II secretory pathway pseudopilin PulG